MYYNMGLFMHTLIISHAHHLLTKGTLNLVEIKLTRYKGDREKTTDNGGSGIHFNRFLSQ
jgi:hypothetical protein